jgi:hypothetical protein
MLPHSLILLLLLALGFLVGGYYAAGPDEVSYAGLQFCITLVIVLGLSALPVDTVQSAEGRVFGAAIGFAVALVIALGLWPDNPVSMLRRGLAGSLRNAAVLLSDLLSHSHLSDVTYDRFQEALYVDVRGNLELLHDASFISDSQMHNQPDYKSMAHISATLFAQLFTLWVTLRYCETEQQTAEITGPLSDHVDTVVAILGMIANSIETPEPDSVTNIRERVRRLQAVLPVDSPSPQRNSEAGEAESRFFGIQIAHDIVADLALLVDDLAASPDTGTIPSELAADIQGGR